MQAAGTGGGGSKAVARHLGHVPTPPVLRRNARLPAARLSRKTLLNSERESTGIGYVRARVHGKGRRQNDGGRSSATAKARSSAIPARPSVPSSKRRPIKVMPWGTRRGGENFCNG